MPFAPHIIHNVCIVCGVLYVMYCMWCIICGVLYVVYYMWCIICGVLYVVYCMWCIVCGVLYVCIICVYYMWCIICVYYMSLYYKYTALPATPVRKQRCDFVLCPLGPTSRQDSTGRGRWHSYLK